MIKKLFFIFLLVSLFANKMTAQKGSVQYGFKAGLNIANVVGEETNDFNIRSSIHLGVVVEIPIVEYLVSIQPELLYSFQGYKFEDNESGYEEQVVRLDYVMLPIMIKYYPSPGFSLEVGPQVGMLTSATLEAKTTTDGITERSKDDYKEFISDIDYGVNFGVEYQFEMGIFIQARYNLGISGIIDIDEAFEQKNSVIQFSTGYKF